MLIKHMARKRRAGQLPPLPKGAVFRPRDHKTERLLEILRGIAVTNQQREPLTFYPVRSVAEHFKTPISTVARVYETLEGEGILRSVRGSKTILQGFKSGRHLNVLALIGVPAATEAFVTFQDYRTFFIRIRRELRMRGFAVSMVLFETRHIRSGQLANRIRKHKFDHVLWYRPEVPFTECINHVRDAGVNIIGVQDCGLPAVRCRYEINRTEAMKQIFRNWKKLAGLTEAIVVRTSGNSNAKEEMIQAAAEDTGLDLDFVRIHGEGTHRFLESCEARNNCGLILTSRVASNFAFRAPEALMELMQRRRVAFIEGPPSIAFADPLSVPGDFVLIDWQVAAEQIVSDLISGQALDLTNATVFQATAGIQAPLNQYAQVL
jgi:hypothetical protein